ncbi:histone H2A.Z-like [Ochotona princeps]|uniref:histone H2A.Z-like n=1 Tax=Ochotona princeps TaxID=9978 RepID=UPI001788D432|nr:histone H2A.Z-like [Ochotona princeps]
MPVRRDGEFEIAGNKAGRDSGNTKTRMLSCLQRAGLQCPMGSIHQYLKSRMTSHVYVGTTVTVYSTAILDNLTTEVLGLARHASKDLKLMCFTLHHLQVAIRGNEEMDSLTKATITSGNVIPHIHKSLIGDKGQQKTDQSMSGFLTI